MKSHFTAALIRNIIWEDSKRRWQQNRFIWIYIYIYMETWLNFFSFYFWSVFGRDWLVWTRLGQVHLGNESSVFVSFLAASHINTWAKGLKPSSPHCSVHPPCRHTCRHTCTLTRGHMAEHMLTNLELRQGSACSQTDSTALLYFLLTAPKASWELLFLNLVI